MAAGIRELEGLGFRVLAAEDLGRRLRFTAGSVERRVAEIHELFANPEVRAVVCARGGAGALSLLPRSRPRSDRGLSQALRRLQRRHRAPSLPRPPGPRDRPRPHGRPRRWSAGRYHRESFLAALSGEGAPYASEPDDLRDPARGRGGRDTARRLPVDARGGRGHALGAPARRRRDDPLHRGRARAAVPDRPDADPAPPGRRLRGRAGRRVRRHEGMRAAAGEDYTLEDVLLESLSRPRRAGGASGCRAATRTARTSRCPSGFAHGSTCRAESRLEVLESAVA